MVAGGAHDLAGGSHTITADTTETYFTFTDSVGGGTLTLEAGSTLEFDDAAGAGFLATSVAFTIIVNGNSTSKCTIKSANSYPDYRWTLALPAAILGDHATRCVFRDYVGTFPAEAIWPRNSCEYITDPYTYATSTELVNLTGTTLPEAAIHEILGQATNEINSRLAMDGITVSSASDINLRAIGLNKAFAMVMRRMFADGTRAGSVNTDGGGSGPDPMTLANEREAMAETQLKWYIREHLPSTRKRLWAQKVNPHG
jgi:hypothetical protein